MKYTILFLLTFTLAPSMAQAQNGPSNEHFIECRVSNRTTRAHEEVYIFSLSRSPDVTSPVSLPARPSRVRLQSGHEFSQRLTGMPNLNLTVEWHGNYDHPSTNISIRHQGKLRRGQNRGAAHSQSSPNNTAPQTRVLEYVHSNAYYVQCTLNLVHSNSVESVSRQPKSDPASKEQGAGAD